MPSPDSLATVITTPTVLGLVGAVILVLAFRLRRLKWRDIEVSFGRDDSGPPPS